MTLYQIITAALLQLDRGNDMLDEWRDKFTLYANDAIDDLAIACKCRKVEKLNIQNGMFLPSSLTNVCLRILSINKGEKALKFSFSGTDLPVYVSQVNENETVSVCYRYLPARMTCESDEPDIPSLLHPLIVSYVVARERMSGDVSTQSGANAYMDMYETGKRRLASSILGQDRFKIQNRY